MHARQARRAPGTRLARNTAATAEGNAAADAPGVPRDRGVAPATPFGAGADRRERRTAPGAATQGVRHASTVRRPGRCAHHVLRCLTRAAAAERRESSVCSTQQNPCRPLEFPAGCSCIEGGSWGRTQSQAPAWARVVCCWRRVLAAATCARTHPSRSRAGERAAAPSWATSTRTKQCYCRNQHGAALPHAD
jgi:hypothetical protein